MLIALGVSLVAFTVLYVVLVTFRLRLELLRLDVRALRRRAQELAA